MHACINGFVCIRIYVYIHIQSFSLQFIQFIQPCRFNPLHSIQIHSSSFQLNYNSVQFLLASFPVENSFHSFLYSCWHLSIHPSIHPPMQPASQATQHNPSLFRQALFYTSDSVSYFHSFRNLVLEIPINSKQARGMSLLDAKHLISLG